MPATTTKSSSTGIAERFADNPFVLWTRLQREMEELLFHRSCGRHHTANETSEVKSHSAHKADAVELAMALAVAIKSGALEPRAPEVDE